MKTFYVLEARSKLHKGRWWVSSKSPWSQKNSAQWHADRLNAEAGSNVEYRVRAAQLKVQKAGKQ